MKILLVNNNTKYLHRLRNLLRSFEVYEISWKEIDVKTAERYECCVLSGGHPYGVMKNPQLFGKETELVRQTRKPLIGICLGFELIAYAFGSALKKMSGKEQGILGLKILLQDAIFDNLPGLEVFENHRWVVETLSPELVPLARSKDGIEIIRHISRPIYGVQFHPEMFVNKTCGDELFMNIFRQISSSPEIHT